LQFSVQEVEILPDKVDEISFLTLTEIAPTEIDPEMFVETSFFFTVRTCFGTY